MPPWPQQGRPAPIVTRPTSLETWLGQNHLTSSGGGPGPVSAGPSASHQAVLAAGTSSGVSNGRVEDQAAALQRSLVPSTYSPRWLPPGPPQPVAPAVPTVSSILRHEPGHSVGYGAPRTYPISTTAIPVPQMPMLHQPNPTEQWPLLRPQLHIHAADTQRAAAAPQTPMAVDRSVSADAGVDSGADEQDEIPLVLSDLDPQYHSQFGQPSAEKKGEEEQKEQSKPQAQIPVPATQPYKNGLAGGLISLSTQPVRGEKAHKAAQRNGTAKDKSSRRTVTTVPVPASTPKRTKATTIMPPEQKRPSHKTTPIPPTPPSSFSVVIPVATPRASGRSSDHKAATAETAAGSAPVSAAPATPAPAEKAEARKNPMPPAPSPVVAVGRRSKSIGNLVRINGRPKGWKPGMSYREVALRNAGIEGEEAAAFLFPPPRRRRRAGEGEGEGDAFRRQSNKKRCGAARSDGNGDRRRPSYVLAKRSGRPPAPSIESVQRAIFLNSPAMFMPYVCEWAGCSAELQNMATLRRHVMVVHGRSATTCQWRRCAGRVPAVSFLGGADAADPNPNPSTAGGTDADAAPTRMDRFCEHMEYQHLAPVEWHQGDGFVNNSHLGPRRPPLSLSTLSATARAKERMATAAAAEDAAMAAPSATGELILPSVEAGRLAANTDGDRGGDGSRTAALPAAEEGGASLEADAGVAAVAAAAAAASTAFASYNVPSEDLPRYLLDEHGKQVTPLLRDPLFELSTAFPTPEEQARRLRELYRYRIGSRYPAIC